MSARGQWNHSPLGHRPLPRAARVPAPCSSGLSGLRVPVPAWCLPSAPGPGLPWDPSHPACWGRRGELGAGGEAGATHPDKDFQVPGRCCETKW